MRVFSIINPATKERALLITLCPDCTAQGRMTHLARQEQPTLPPNHRCGYCGAQARQCVMCGCTDFAPCEGGCQWIDPALTDGQQVCSVCYQQAIRSAGAQQNLLAMP